MSSPTNELLPDKTEEFISRGVVEWYKEGRIVAYRLKSADEAIFQAWEDKVAEVLGNWPQERPYLALHDISSPGCATFYMIYAHYRILNVGVSPNYRKQAEEIIAAQAHPARVAVVLSMSLSGRLTQRSTELIEQDKALPIEYKTYFDRQRALQWLSGGIVE